METVSPRPKITSLRRLLCMHFGVLVAVSTLALTTGFLVFVLFPLSERIATGKFNALTTTLQARLDAEFHPPALALELLADNWRHVPPAVDDEHDFNRGVEPILRHFPQATSAVAGTSDGEGWMLLHQDDGSWLNRLSNVGVRGNTQWFVERSTTGDIHRHIDEKNHDPRQRLWYQQAVGQTSVQWTPAYPFFTTGEPGVTAAVHRRLADGRDLVIGVDLKLRDLSLTTMEARIGQSGFATILTDDLRVLALPRPPSGHTGEWPEKLLRDHRELGIASIDQAIQTWQQKRPKGVFEIRVNGDKWLAQVSPYALGQQALHVLILAPSRDFYPDLLGLGILLAGGLGSLLLLSSFFAYRQARRIAHPLEALADTSKRIGQLDFTDNEVIKHERQSRIAEVRALASAQEEMRQLLADNQKKIEAQAIALQKLAHHDSLTGLPNRGYFIEALQQAIRQASRDKKEIAVLFLDLDRFKEINDSHGHETGDAVLCEVARRFREVMRQNELLARIGGDEFAIVANNTDEASAQRIAIRLTETMRAPIQFAQTCFQLGVSIGISIFPVNANSAEELLRTADIAMYQAKSRADGMESHFVAYAGSPAEQTG